MLGISYIYHIKKQWKFNGVAANCNFWLKFALF